MKVAQPGSEEDGVDEKRDGSGSATPYRRYDAHVTNMSRNGVTDLSRTVNTVTVVFWPRNKSLESTDSMPLA